MKLFKTLGGTVNAIEDMVIKISNDYVSKINEKEKEIANLKKEVSDTNHDNGVLILKVDKLENKIDRLEKELNLSKKANKVLEDRIKELKSNGITNKTIMDCLNDCRELLKNTNEVAKENHKLKKPTKKDLKLESMGKVSSDAKAKMK